MKVCKECRHFQKGWIAMLMLDESLYRCKSPKQGVDPINGGLAIGFASLNRKFEMQCGHDGKWFEPKEKA